MDSVIAFLTGLVGFEVSPTIIIGVAALVEFALRFIKSEKALGLIHGASFLIKKVSQAVGLVAALVAKIADLSDKVLPQKVVPPQA
jgi:hypothetical protein